MTKLNLGCGPHTMLDWINYDLDKLPGSVAIKLDLSRGELPHADESVDFIFSEHFIEHITKDQAKALLRECFRVLKPDGVLRVVTPDLDRLVEQYVRGNVAKIPGVWEPNSACEMLNEGMRLWGHQYLYDKEEFGNMLQESGFKSAWDCARHISKHDDLKGLEVRPEHFEMYIEAEKNPIKL